MDSDKALSGLCAATLQDEAQAGQQLDPKTATKAGKGGSLPWLYSHAHSTVTLTHRLHY